MKRFLKFLVLASSIGLVGCTGITNNIAMSYLSDALKEVQDIDPSQQVICVEKNLFNSGCAKHLQVGDLSIVEESAEGHDRVILKFYGSFLPNLLGQTQDGWYYIGVDFTSDDWDVYNAADEVGKIDKLLQILSDGCAKYGTLRFEGADREFFWKDNGVWTIFSESVASIKDVELMGSKVEDKNAVALGEKLSAQYGLSNERGQVVAKTLAAYNKLASKRTLTSEEKNQFSTKLIGVDYKTAERAVKTGNAADFQALMEQAAMTNGTSPEAVSAIIKDMVL